MQPLPCFVCGIVTNIYCKDVTELRSKHTETEIFTYFKKFVGEDLFNNINPTNNKASVVCQNCIIKIDDYDELYMNAMSLENELRNMLIKTLEERSVNDLDPEFDDVIEYINDEEVSPTDNVAKSYSMYCNICNMNFESFTELKTHDHAARDVFRTKQRTWQKTTSPIVHGTFTNYNNVMIQKSKGKSTIPTLKCSLCSLMFVNKFAIQKHYNESHFEDNRCDICGGRYVDKEKRQEHLARHSYLKDSLQCVDCDRVFKVRSALMKHMKIHTHEKLFVCELCGKQFTHHSSFKMHMMSHDDVREKKCEDCGQLFRSSSHLNRHKRVHTNEKPFECLICHRLFAQRYNMMAHFKLHSEESQTETNQETYVCTVCSANFPSSNELNDHFEMVHNEVSVE